MNAPTLNIARDTDALLAAIVALPDAQAFDLLAKAWDHLQADLAVRWPTAHEAVEAVEIDECMTFDGGYINPFSVIDKAAAQLRGVVL